jgi:uncharacterized protein (DUF302 family)
MSYYFSKILNVGFDEAIERVTKLLQENGFGIVSEIFVSEVLKNKIGVDLPPYKILGACNPNFAYKALTVEDKIGLMLPCNIVVRKISDSQTEVSGIDPVASMMAIKNPDLQDLALEVQNHIKKVIENL